VVLLRVCSCVIGFPPRSAALVGVTGIVPGIGRPCTGAFVLVTLLPPVVVLELVLDKELFPATLVLVVTAGLEDTVVFAPPIGTVIPFITVVPEDDAVVAAAESFNRWLIRSLTLASLLTAWLVDLRAAGTLVRCVVVLFF
jgi:hypothetical protein